MKKIDSKEYYDFLKENGFSTEAALLSVRVAIHGATFVKACYLAQYRYSDNLMPEDCIQVLEECYGKKLSKMKPKTIHEKVYNMLSQVTDNPDNEGIADSVQSYLNDY